MDETQEMAREMDEGRFEGVARALSRGANANALSESGMPALGLAAKAGALEAVEALLKAGADPHARCRLGHTALALASEFGRDACVLALLPASDASLENRWGQSALSIAQGLGEEALRALAAASDLSARCDEGLTPLHRAASRGDARLLEIILSAEGAQSRARCGNSALSLAARGGHDRAMQMLLPLSDAKSFDAEGRCALDWLIKRRARGERGGPAQERLIEELARLGDPDRRPMGRASPFEVACAANDAAAAKVLAKHSKCSGLIAAITSSANETARLLCKMPKQLTRPGFDGRYPLQAMAEAGNVEWVLNILDAGGGCANALDKALEYASPKIKMLIQAWQSSQEERALLEAIAPVQEKSKKSAARL
jgi:hypothetical protein